MPSTLIIRQAESKDTSVIADFLANADCIHRHLDWQGVLEWIPEKPFLVLQKTDHILGLLTCPPDLEKIAWIRCFACNDLANLPLVWEALFNEVLKTPQLSGSSLFSVGLNDWFADTLRASQFINFQDIVVLMWNQRMPSTKGMDQSVLIRPMENSDLKQVADLDQESFEMIWVNPLDKINLAFLQAEHASVAEYNGRIIGYELSTANHFSAHLARIAIHPDFQQKHIGSELIIEMFRYFYRKGIKQISVNTQSSNNASLALYKSLGFELTGERFPVFRYNIP